MNAQTFEAWLEQHLLPTLEEGDIVALDKLRAHKSPRVAEIPARRNSTVGYLPPYSPDLMTAACIGSERDHSTNM